MNIRELIQGASVDLLRGRTDREIKTVTQDSRTLTSGGADSTLFFALRGLQSDGHLHLDEVCRRGVAGVVVEDSSRVPADYSGAVLKSADIRTVLDLAAHRFYGEPSRKLICVGVTGTNGKTTVTHLVEHLLNQQDVETGVIGTIDHHLKDRSWPTQLTTPDSLSVHQRIREFSDLGAKGLAIEMSSHALNQRRGEFIQLNAAIFTNLSRDHLDYHSDMEDYFNSKARLFTEILQRSEKSGKFAVVNLDDAFGMRLAAARGVSVMGYGQSPHADLKFQILGEDFSGSRVRWDFQGEVHEGFLRLPCRYNIQNAASALVAVKGLGLSFSQACEDLENFSGVKGRLERVNNGRNLNVFVDYAHTDDALRNVLDSLNSIRTKNHLRSKIITVFGCGGDRDRGKRPLMAKAAIEGSDFVVVTSDNPRTEDPAKIINDILEGVPKSSVGKTVFSEIQRREAIELALETAQEGDVVLIAGKGHEEYQIVGKNRLPFSDVAIVKEILS